MKNYNPELLEGNNGERTEEKPEEITNNETLEPQDNHSELVDFSKRYSRAGRKEIADEIRELRFQYFKKEKGNPERQETIAGQEKSIEALQKEKDLIEEEIRALEDEVEQQKASLWHKISSMFRKNEIEQELQLDPKKKKLEDLKKDIEGRLKIIGETESVILDISSLDEAKTKLAEFYKEQSDLKSSFESEEKERDIETLSKDKGYIFLHGIPTKNRNMNNTAENNPAMKTSGMSTEDKLSLLMGLEPTVSASVLKEGQQDAQTYYTFGVILGGGKVLSAYKEDSGTLAESLYSRRSKYDRETKQTSIQPNITAHLDEAVNAPVESRNWGKYNEIVVEQPKVAGLYINLSQLNNNYDRIGIGELKRYSEIMNLPIYALKDGEIYPFDIDSKIGVMDDGRKYQKENAFEAEGNKLSLDNVIDSRREIGQEEKLKLATSVIEKNPFQISTDGEYELYNAYSRGTYGIYNYRKGYDNLLMEQELHKKRIAAGIEESDPGTPEDVLKKMEERLEELKQRIADATSNEGKNFTNRDLKKELISLYGFALNAQENGDAKTFDAAKNMIEKYGSFDECANLIKKRVDEKGDFKTLDTDVPIEIRKKMSELEGVSSVT